VGTADDDDDDDDAVDLFDSCLWYALTSISISPLWKTPFSAPLTFHWFNKVAKHIFRDILNAYSRLNVFGPWWDKACALFIIYKIRGLLRVSKKIFK